MGSSCLKKDGDAGGDDEWISPDTGPGYRARYRARYKDGSSQKKSPEDPGFAIFDMREP
jgi:hypothetical protein